MACRCFHFINQHSTVRGYLAAIKFFHKLYLGWELTTSHYMIAAAGKGIDRSRGMSGRSAQVRLPLTWSILGREYLTVTSTQEGGDVMWLGLALPYFLLCRASELFAYANALVHPEFCLTCDCLTFCLGDVQVNIDDRARADSVKVLLAASKTDQNRKGCTTTRVRMHGGRGGGWQDTGRSFRTTGGAPRRTPATSRRRPPDDEKYGVWVERDNSDRSSRYSENDGSKRV